MSIRIQSCIQYINIYIYIYIYQYQHIIKYLHTYKSILNYTTLRLNMQHIKQSMIHVCYN